MPPSEGGLCHSPRDMQYGKELLQSFILADVEPRSLNLPNPHVKASVLQQTPQSSEEPQSQRSDMLATSLQDQVTPTNQGTTLHFNKVPKASEVKKHP